ncbi:hypothetical protein JKP88DRAFT_279222 [Tribonema minus]|uniref:Uncharacterized protein n=1 Tax=Tribonema minus TaxID=303371 RepID=A0A836CBY5_9STRA|nr:hypothetical protein JKP88DRAFT_279222 [Tribonema minus]
MPLWYEEWGWGALAKNSRRYFEKCAKRDPQPTTPRTLCVQTRHNCTWERRMPSSKSYRARERAVARMARSIVMVGPRDTRVRRVVFFGKAEFRSGSHGPWAIPRKRLIQHLACLAPVVLGDEFFTSITCPKDRAPLQHRGLEGLPL